MTSISGSMSAASTLASMAKPPAPPADDKSKTAAPAANTAADASSGPKVSSRVGAFLALDSAPSPTGRADSDGEIGPDNDGDADDAAPAGAAGSGNPGIRFDETGTYSPAASN